MKIHAQSLTVIRQAMVGARALLSVMLTEGVARPERGRTIKQRTQDLTDAIKLIDDSLGTTTIDPRPPPDSWKDTLVTKSEEIDNG